MDLYKLDVYQRLLRKARSLLPKHLSRLDWKRDQIHSAQTKQLKKILQHALKHSPYYQERCQLENESITLENLKKIRPTTKKELMASWDKIICTSKLNKQIAENFLESCRKNPQQNPFYLDQYYITATGGSSGLRGLFVWDLDYFAEVGCTAFRYQYRDEQKNPGDNPKKIAVLTAPTAIHASTPLFSMTLDEESIVHHLPADELLPNLCKKLNQIQPYQLIGYSSVMVALAECHLSEKLNIHPQRVSTNSEPLDKEARDIIRKAWKIEVNNMWGSVEMGMAGIEDDRHLGLILSEDMLIIEPVDEQLESVETPEEARKLLITNLFNYTMPLIRYVIDDAVLISSDSKLEYRVVKNIEGRADDWFHYNNHIQIHPMIFRHILGQEPAIAEYQVQQTPNGSIIRLVASKKINKVSIQSTLIKTLKEAGLKKPDITIKVCNSIPRHEETGKLKRFIPLKRK